MAGDVMDADWYADPLGRFDGRYWDGSEWTERVSDRGIQALDPDWPLDSGESTAPGGTDTAQFDSSSEPAIVPLVPAAKTTTRASSAAVDRRSQTIVTAELPREDVEDPDLDGGRAEPGEDDPDVVSRDADGDHDVESEAPAPSELEGDTAPAGDTAVAALQPTVEERIDYSVESPHRSVAVLDPPITEEVGDTPSPAGTDDQGARSWLLWLGAAALIGLALLVLPRLFRGTDPGDVAVDNASGDQISAVDQELDSDVADPGTAAEPAEEAATTVDEEAPPIPTVAAEVTPAEVPAAASEEADPPQPTGEGQVAAGDRIIANGEAMLTELAEWHVGWAQDNGGELAPDASCWFGVVGRALAQSAHCGPITTGAGPQFTLVPVLFQDIGGDGVVEAVPVLDAVVANAPLPMTIEFADASGLVDPASVGATTGERGLRGG